MLLKLKNGVFFVGFLVIVSLCVPDVFSVPENLDEIFTRKARIQSGQTYSIAELEDASNHYIWQPESLMYTDIQTGHEVWKVAGFPGPDYYRDIGYSPWSADGKRMGFVSWRDSNAISENWRDWMVVNTDGSILRKLPGAPAETRTSFMHWNPQVPDTYYEFGRESGFSGTMLYKVTVTDTGVESKPILQFPTGHTSPYNLLKSIAPDGDHVVAFGDGESWMFPAQVCEDGDLDVYGNELCNGQTPSLMDPDGYTADRPWDCWWLDCAVPWVSLHDQFMGGAGDDVWFYVMPEAASGTWWRIRLTGSASDGGPGHTEDHTEPYVWGGEMEPLSSNTPAHNRPYCNLGATPENDADCGGYFSHFVTDVWGRNTLFSKSEGPYPYGPGVYDMDARDWVTSDFALGAQHHGWNGWSDYVVSSAAFGPAESGDSNDQVIAAKYDDGDSQFSVAYAHTRINGGETIYEALIRPTQSPDGTKAAFASTFQNINDNNPDLYWAVVHYPYPPTITGASKSGNNVRITWDPPHYTDRGWPNEATDPAPLPKEIKNYHIYTSSNGGSTWVLDINSRTPHTQFSYDRNQLPSTTWLYAMTSEEHSGLESRTLSNVWQVSLDASGNIVSSIQTQGYPSEPGGVSNFYAAEPVAPINFEYNQVSAGKYQLTWTEPMDPSIRFYNIYYSNSGTPEPIQQNRIASVPVGTNSYLDWIADPNNAGYYLVSSVNRQGLEKVAGGGAPTVSNLQCNSGGWTDCAALTYGSSMTQIRTTCTDDEGTVSSASFSLWDVDRNIEVYNIGTSDQTNNVFTVTLLTPLFINTSGDYRMTATCQDNEGNQGSQIVTWSVPYGTLTSTTVVPANGFQVENGTVFTYTTRLQCTGGECGNISATLDPIVAFQEGSGSYGTTRDNTLRAGVDYSGSDDGVRLQSSLDLRGMITYIDVMGSDDGQVPPGAKIDSATLTMTVSQLDWGTGTIAIYQILDPSGHGYPAESATWTNRNSNPWASAGGDIAGTYDDSISSAGAAVGDTFEFDVTDTVQDWADSIQSDPDTDQGWILRYISDGGLLFASSEHATLGWRPKLTVEYSGGGFNPAKGVIPVGAGNPFYVTNTNPLYCTTLVGGDSCETTWLVAANGVNGTYEFFVIYDAENPAVTDIESEHRNVEISLQVSNCSIPYDKEPCGCIDIGEITDSINGWYQDQITLSQLINAMKVWKGGC